MDLKYSMHETLFGGGHRISTIIKGVENACRPFNLVCKQNPQGQWGIFLELKKAEANVLIDPIKLVNSVYRDERFWLKGETISDYISGNYIVDTHDNGICFEWLMAMTDAPLAGFRRFTYAEYISKIRNAIDDLLVKIREGLPLVYDKERVNLENITLCSLQLGVECTLPTHRYLRSQDIEVEKFSLIPKEKWGNYTIYLSQRSCEYSIEDFGADFEKLRLELELYLVSHTTTLSYDFQCRDINIQLSQQSFNKSIKEKEEGIFFDYDYYTLVTIQLSEWENNPILRGYCETSEVVRELYEGFLFLAYKCYEDMAYPGETDFLLYNRFKSPLLEAYIKGDKNKQENKIEITKLWIIYPEYDVCVSEITDSNIPFEVSDDTFEELTDVEGNPVIIPGFSQWAAEIRPVILAAETGKSYEFDWDNYHKRGLALAHKLRDVLPADIDLWYQAPFEDNSGLLPRPILIIK